MAKPMFTDENGEVSDKAGLFVIKLINSVEKTCLHCEAFITTDITTFMAEYQPGGGDQALNHWLKDSGFDLVEIYKVDDYSMIGASTVDHHMIKREDLPDTDDPVGDLIRGLNSVSDDIVH